MNSQNDYRNQKFNELSEDEFRAKIEEIKRNNGFKSADLRGIDFRGRDLRNLNFSEALLHGANFMEADITNSDFQEAKTGITSVNSLLIRIGMIPISLMAGIVVSYSSAFLVSTIKIILDTKEYRIEYWNLGIFGLSLLSLLAAIVLTFSKGLREYLLLSVLAFIGVNFINAAFLSDNNAGFTIINISCILGVFSSILIQTIVTYVFRELYRATYRRNSSISIINIAILFMHASFNALGLYLGARQAHQSIDIPIPIIIGFICLSLSYWLGWLGFDIERRSQKYENRRRYRNNVKSPSDSPYAVMSRISRAILKPWFTCFVETEIESTNFKKAQLTYGNFYGFEGILLAENDQATGSSEISREASSTTTNYFFANEYTFVGDQLASGATKIGGDMVDSAYTAGDGNKVTLNAPDIR